MIALKTKSPICNFTPKARNLCDVCWPRMKGKIRHPPCLLRCSDAFILAYLVLRSFHPGVLQLHVEAQRKQMGKSELRPGSPVPCPRLLAAPCNHLETFTGSNGGEEEGRGEGGPGL